MWHGRLTGNWHRITSREQLLSSRIWMALNRLLETDRKLTWQPRVKKGTPMDDQSDDKSPADPSPEVIGIEPTPRSATLIVTLEPYGLKLPLEGDDVVGFFIESNN
jgi:hypothetical protein